MTLALFSYNSSYNSRATRREMCLIHTEFKSRKLKPLQGYCEFSSFWGEVSEFSARTAISLSSNDLTLFFDLQVGHCCLVHQGSWNNMFNCMLCLMHHLNHPINPCDPGTPVFPGGPGIPDCPATSYASYIFIYLAAEWKISTSRRI